MLTRRVYPRPVLGELECFIRGTSRLSDFKAAGCNYWDANALAWLPGGNSVGRIYGVQWRHWRTTDGSEVDQLENLINRMRDDPNGRRHILTAWNPGELLEMCLPPCHIMAQFHIEDHEVDCLVTMRSVDLCIGLPADMILYGMLLNLVAREVGRTPRSLIFSFGNTHIYENHLMQAEMQLERKVSDCLPRMLNPIENDLFRFKADHVQWQDYNPSEPIAYTFNV